MGQKYRPGRLPEQIICLLADDTVDIHELGMTRGMGMRLFKESPYFKVELTPMDIHY